MKLEQQLKRWEQLGVDKHLVDKVSTQASERELRFQAWARVPLLNRPDRYRVDVICKTCGIKWESELNTIRTRYMTPLHVLCKRCAMRARSEDILYQRVSKARTILSSLKSDGKITGAVYANRKGNQIPDYLFHFTKEGVVIPQEAVFIDRNSNSSASVALRALADEGLIDWIYHDTTVVCNDMGWEDVKTGLYVSKFNY